MGFALLDRLLAPDQSGCLRSAAAYGHFRGRPRKFSSRLKGLLKTSYKRVGPILITGVCVDLCASSNSVFAQQVQTEVTLKDSQNIAERSWNAPANTPLDRPTTQRVPGGAMVDDRKNVHNEARLRIDPALAQSLAKTGCAVHNHSNSPVPFADFLNLPTGPYTRVFGTKSGTRYFAIVADDCDYVGNPAAPSIRMVSTHRMDGGLIYVALFDAKGDVLALLRETPGTPPRYATAGAGDIEIMYADLKSEAQSWSGAINRMLEAQTEQERAPAMGNNPH